MTTITATAGSGKMICQKCGAEMNHHGDKLVQASDSDAARPEESLGGFLEEFHSCPKCGWSGSRPARA